VTILAVVAELAIEADLDPESSIEYGIGVLVATAWAQAGHHVLLALTERIEDAERHGVSLTLGRVVRSIPWRRVLIADVVVLALTLAGYVAFVVPGLVLTVLLTPVFPLLAIEGRCVRATLRRSIGLVRGSFWRLATLLALTWGLGQLFALAVGALAPDDSVLDVLFHAGTQFVIAPLSAAVAVAATFELLEYEIPKLR